MSKLSVVLISRNQEANICRLLRSVLEHTAAFPDTEVVLVDSASTDRTVELARRFPVRIIQLHPGQQLTASTGRYVGTHATHGDHILFLDGDMALHDGWLERAFLVMEHEPDVAGLTGELLEVPATVQPGHDPDPVPLYRTTQIVEIAHTGGASLIRRRVLDEVGTFYPYVYSDEEPDLCLRIRHHGYRLLRLPHPIAYHHSDPIRALPTLLERRKRRLWHGSGQLLRLHAGTEYFWPYVRERGHGVQAGLTLLILLSGVLAALRYAAWQWLVVGQIGLLGGLAAIAYRKGGIYPTVYSLVLRGLVLDGTVRGLFLPQIDPHKTPVQYTIIQSDERIAS